MPGIKKLCPCGSGKPYAQCCGAAEVCSLDQVRWRRAAQELRQKLGEFADQPSFAWDAARAQDTYLGCLDPELMPHDDDFTMERCFEWFIFDFALSGGATVIETFRGEYPHPLSKFEKMLVQEWVRARISLYEVHESLPGKGLVIKDLLTRRKLLVHDLNAAGEISAGCILLMRVLKVGEEYEFSTSGLALPNWCKAPLLQKLRRDRIESGIRTWAAYLKARSHKINAWVMELGTDSPFAGKQVAGQREQYKIMFDLPEWRELLALLKQSDAFVVTQEIKNRAGAFKSLAAAWLGDARPPRGGYTADDVWKSATYGQAAGKRRNNGVRPVLGHILLTPGSVVITTGSPGLLALGKKLLTGGFPGFEGDDAAGAAVLEEHYPWPEPGYAMVADSVRDGLRKRGYDAQQQKGAMKLWFDYCSKERPAIRKTAVWAAAVIYAFSRLEMARELKQQDLAGQYGVASSTISMKFRLLCRSLELVAYDKRYATKRPPLHGFGLHNLLLY